MKRLLFLILSVVVLATPFAKGTTESDKTL